MKRIAGCVFIMVCFCFSLYAQTSSACKEQLRQLSLPGTALTDYDIAPMELLFSDHGQDVYSATSYHRSDPLKWIQDNGATVIVVYQDEAVRQKQIESLRGRGALPSRAGFPQRLENIKYSMINFFGPAAAFVRDIEYFEPKVCVSASEESAARINWMDSSDLQIWAMPGLHASKNEPNWITGFYSPYMIVSAKENPMYIKIHNILAVKVKEYLDRNQHH